MLRLNNERASADRLVIHELSQRDARAGFAADVRQGLTSEHKHLFPKYFYDELGSALFEAICLLPEYYLTRAENEVLKTYAGEIVECIAGYKRLLELGSGSASKTRLIIEALLARQQYLTYIPVDISASALEISSRVLLQSYARLEIEAYAADYYEGLSALSEKEPRERTLALFLGSNIGNFDADEARKFLRALRQVLKAGDALLLGADLKKEKAVLEAAYDDALGVTAAFNLNLLSRINCEFGANFNLRSFRHIARYNEEAGCVEVFIESTREQTVTIPALDMQIHFAGGERIHTENSCKYDEGDLARLAAETGYELTHTWLDDARRFSSNLFVAV